MSQVLTRKEWEEFVQERLLDLYERQIGALDLIARTDQNLKELIAAVSKLTAVVERMKK